MTNRLKGDIKMIIKLKEFKELIWNASLLNYRLFHLKNCVVNVSNLEMLWESKNLGDWANIGGKKYDDYYVQEIQTNIPNTIDILISKTSDYKGD